jgi:hypothetical protein
MANDPKRKSPKKKPKRASEQEPCALRIEIPKKPRAKLTSKDIELAIKKKLEASPTDLFRNCDTLLIMIQEEGN